MSGQFKHPGLPASDGIPDPKKVQSELDLLEKKFQALKKGEEKSRIGRVLFIIHKP